MSEKYRSRIWNENEESELPLEWKKLVKLQVDFIWALSYQVECRVVYFYIVLCHKSLLLPIMGLIKSIKHKSYLVAATTHQRRRAQKVRKTLLEIKSWVIWS